MVGIEVDESSIEDSFFGLLRLDSNDNESSRDGSGIGSGSETFLKGDEAGMGLVDGSGLGVIGFKDETFDANSDRCETPFAIAAAIVSPKNPSEVAYTNAETNGMDGEKNDTPYATTPHVKVKPIPVTADHCRRLITSRWASSRAKRIFKVK